MQIIIFLQNSIFIHTKNKNQLTLTKYKLDGLYLII